MATRMREKTEKVKAERDKRPTAIAKYIRISSSKVEIVMDLIRGKGYTEAVAILKNTPKSASPVILKVLNSAAANAENNLNMAKDGLYVAECYATAGPTYKRMMPRARGRADRILKRTSHIRVILDEREDAKVNQRRKTTKDDKSKSAEVTMKTTTKTAQATKGSATVSKPAAKAPAKLTPREVPNTQSERPLTDTTNAKKPLGTKPLPAKSLPTSATKPQTSKKDIQQKAGARPVQAAKDAKKTAPKGGK